MSKWSESSRNLVSFRVFGLNFFSLVLLEDFFFSFSNCCTRLFSIFWTRSSLFLSFVWRNWIRSLLVCPLTTALSFKSLRQTQLFYSSENWKNICKIGYKKWNFNSHFMFELKVSARGSSFHENWWRWRYFEIFTLSIRSLMYFHFNHGPFHVVFR